VFSILFWLLNIPFYGFRYPLMGKALHGYNSNALCGLEHPEKVNSRLISIVNRRRLGLIEFNKEIQKLVALLSKTDVNIRLTRLDTINVIDYTQYFLSLPNTYDCM
jgi:hypothetical protein